MIHYSPMECIAFVTLSTKYYNKYEIWKHEKQHELSGLLELHEYFDI